MSRSLKRTNERSKAVLVLEDGSLFCGKGFGVTKRVSGEIVFSTSMIGYPEALTDPSYKGQILTLTYPLVGNYGVPRNDSENGVLRYFESNSIKVTGLVVHELCTQPYHWESSRTLDEWLASEDVPGIYGIDTRKLVKKLRVKGVMLGTLEVCEENEEPDLDRLVNEVKSVEDPNLRDLVSEVSIEEPVYHGVKGNNKVVLIDCGVKHGILRSLLRRGIDVVRVPYDFSAKEILEYKPNGIVISNGPGDPKKCGRTMESAKELVDEGIPVMGICLGAQILALGLGGDTYKLKYGHRSQNQPALDLLTKMCYITTQNHGYAVDPDSLKGTDLETWFINANDKTVEAIKHKSKPALGFQWHPEAEPGPYDTEFLFDAFLKLGGR
ncbi:MAG: glutamine-hydrolyzing carbamoyl-phosphate synthase small subunit [Candidatus Bathyarchaeia archaeon]